MEKGKVHFNDLYSEKTGKTYAADILLDDTGGKYVNFKLEFTDSKKGGSSKKSQKGYVSKSRYPQKYPQKGALTR